MAVVSISKIQVRQGRKYGDEGIPQLASGEFGWAIDAQELYIGNGSVEDGAPYVGNTRILTDTDNIFDLASDYEYRDSELQTGLTSDSPVTRSLQDRLDDWVNIRAFGATGDGSNQTAQIQNAIDQLFLNSESGNPKSRVALVFDPGVYLLSSTVEIPPYCHIIGGGTKQTVFETTGGFSAFKTRNSVAPSGTDPTYNTQARHITLFGFTVKTSSGNGIDVVDCRDSQFIDINIERETMSSQDSGMYLESFGSFSGVGSRRNYFNRVSIKNFGKCVSASTGIYENSWSNCRFTNADVGFELVSDIEPSVFNVIETSVFDEIDREGILIEGGEDNTSRFNKYRAVGTTGNEAFVTDHFSNASIDDWFQRSEISYSSVDTSEVYHRNVASNNITQSAYTQRVSTSIKLGSNRLIKLPASGKMGYQIDYLYRSNELGITRTGTLTVSLDVDRDTGTPIADRNNIGISDEYLVSGSPQDGETLSLTGELVDESENGTIDSLIINMNNTSPIDDGEILFRVMSKG